MTHENEEPGTGKRAKGLVKVWTIDLDGRESEVSVINGRIHIDGEMVSYETVQRYGDIFHYARVEADRQKTAMRKGAA